MTSSASGAVYISRRINSLRLTAADKYNISPENCHVGHITLMAMTKNPNGVNQIDAATEESETNGSVMTRSTRLASAMWNYGLEIGDVVVIMGPNHLDVAIPYYACHYNGYSVCAVDATITQTDEEHLFKDISPKMVFCRQAQAKSATAALTQCGLDSPIILFDGITTNMETFITGHKGTHVDFRPAEFDQKSKIAWLLMTSGSTGRPKTAIINYDTLVNSICCWWSQFTEPAPRALTIGTIQWMSAMLFYITGPTMGFTRIQSSSPLTPQSLVQIINKYKPNIAVWTPYLLQKFLQATSGVCDLSSFKYIAIGGSSVEKPLIDILRKSCNAYLYLVYGMTELMVPIFDFNKNTPFGSSGKPFSKFEYRLVKDDESLANTNEDGELWIRGDEFFKGYYKNPEETKAIISEDGWIKTGDMFYKDENNYYYFVERKKLLFKYTGQWISPLQLEDVIMQHPGVEEVCVVSIPESSDDIPVAAVVRKNGCTVDPQEIFNLVQRELPPVKQLHGGLFFMEALPVTPSGKIHRAKTREIALVSQRTLPNKDQISVAQSPTAQTHTLTSFTRNEYRRNP